VHNVPRGSSLSASKRKETRENRRSAKALRRYRCVQLAGIVDEQIAHVYKVTLYNTRAASAHHGKLIRPRYCPGSTMARRPVLAYDWLAIRPAYARGDSLHAVADRFGVRRATLVAHKQREQWEDPDVPSALDPQPPPPPAIAASSTDGTPTRFPLTSLPSLMTVAALRVSDSISGAPPRLSVPAARWRSDSHTRSATAARYLRGTPVNGKNVATMRCTRFVFTRLGA
jgi:hypothetical protein